MVQTPTRLRDLDDDAFAARYDCDRFTATVLSNRYAYVIDNIKDQLLRTAFAPIVRSGDFAAGLSGPPSMGWPMAAVSQTIPVHVGSIPDAVRITLEVVKDRLARRRPLRVVLVVALASPPLAPVSTVHVAVRIQREADAPAH